MLLTFPMAHGPPGIYLDTQERAITAALMDLRFEQRSLFIRLCAGGCARRLWHPGHPTSHVP